MAKAQWLRFCISSVKVSGLLDGRFFADFNALNPHGDTVALLEYLDIKFSFIITTLHSFCFVNH